jgi:hypothetical protein
MQNKVYLGNGIFCEINEHVIKLTVETVVGITDEIILYDAIFRKLTELICKHEKYNYVIEGVIRKQIEEIEAAISQQIKNNFK